MIWMKEHIQNDEIWTASYSCIQFVTARCYAECDYATVYCLSVRPSVCNVQVLRYRTVIIDWNSSKIISRTNSLIKASALADPNMGHLVHLHTIDHNNSH